jgi:hypothetical protein
LEKLCIRYLEGKFKPTTCSVEALIDDVKLQLYSQFIPLARIFYASHDATQQKNNYNDDIGD